MNEQELNNQVEVNNFSYELSDEALDRTRAQDHQVYICHNQCHVVQEWIS